jgi:tagatose-6-phosphate ketose/aldose isomerase
MQHSSSTDTTLPGPGALTHSEIFQQPELWPTTLERVPAGLLGGLRVSGPVVITGAGTSAYAASAVASSWKHAEAIATTDLLTDATSLFPDGGLLVSLARSGDSPESLGVVKRIQRRFPAVQHLAITCNAHGALAQAAGVNPVILDPRTNDRSLAMTSSFSNLVLAGMSLHHQEQLRTVLPSICSRVDSLLPELDRRAQTIAERGIDRVSILASGALGGAAREACLKILEMTAGQVVAIPETFLGLRHGPMSFLRQDSLVLCFLSSDPQVRAYEEDLLDELKRKQLGYILAVAPDDATSGLYHERIPAAAPDLPDYLRTPFEIVFPQLLAYHLSLRLGFNPDSPSPDAVITRVVQGFRIHED